MSSSSSSYPSLQQQQQKNTLTFDVRQLYVRWPAQPALKGGWNIQRQGELERSVAQAVTGTLSQMTNPQQHRDVAQTVLNLIDDVEIPGIHEYSERVAANNEDVAVETDENLFDELASFAMDQSLQPDSLAERKVDQPVRQYVAHTPMIVFLPTCGYVNREDDPDPYQMRLDAFPFSCTRVKLVFVRSYLSTICPVPSSSSFEKKALRKAFEEHVQKRMGEMETRDRQYGENPTHWSIPNFQYGAVEDEAYMELAYPHHAMTVLHQTHMMNPLYPFNEAGSGLAQRAGYTQRIQAELRNEFPNPSEWLMGRPPRLDASKADNGYVYEDTSLSQHIRFQELASRAVTLYTFENTVLVDCAENRAALQHLAEFTLLYGNPYSFTSRSTHFPLL
jgi:hypothetical protein